MKKVLHKSFTLTQESTEDNCLALNGTYFYTTDERLAVENENENKNQVK